MPVDKWRNAGPDDAMDYRNFVVNPAPHYEEDREKLFSAGKRGDGRKADELRKIYMKTGTVASVKGSAYAEVGNTKVLVSVYEPREIPRLTEFCANGELEVEFRFAPFSCPTRRSPLIQSDEKDLAMTLKRALEPAVCRSDFPNCQVDIFVLVLDNDGGCLAAAVTAAGVALADAGIPMFDTVAAVTMGVHNDLTLLDPTLAEEEFCNRTYKGKTQLMGTMTLAYLPSIGQISSFTQEGALTKQQVLGNLDLLIQRCCEVNELSKLTLTNDVLEKLKDEQESEAKSTETSVSKK